MPILLRPLSFALITATAAAATAAWIGQVWAASEPGSAWALEGMSLLTSLGIGLLSVAAWSLLTKRDGLLRGTAWTAAGLGLLAVISHGLTGADHVSEAFSQALFGGRLQAGRMPMATSVSIALLGVAAGSRRSRPWLADGCAGAAALITGTALLGYAYGVEDLHRLSVFNTMALGPALCLFALALAIAAALPSSGWASVVASSTTPQRAMTRWMLAFICLVPVFGGVLISATRGEVIDLGAAMAMLVVTTVAPLALLVLRDGRIRIQLDAERRRRLSLQADGASKLERRLAEKVAELQHEVAERAKVEDAMRHAQRMEAMGRLTGGIAHDFNNLLQALSGNVALLQRRVAESDPSRKYVDNAARAVKKGAKLTGQLLAFSRSQRLTIRPVLVRAALQDAHELIRHSVGPNIVLELEEPSDELWVLGDAQQLELAIVNLAMNARDALPEGGLIRISAHPVLTPPGQAPVQGFLALSVSDNGMGMSPEVAQHAGEPFFTTKDLGKGTGLGLAQVHGFARQCGGDVHIRTAPGQGTQVDIVLPLAAPQTPLPIVPPLGAQAFHPIRAGKRKILVIDDDDSVRSVIVDGLKDAGFEVSEAADGAAGLALLASQPPDAAVIDFMMPTMNGAEVARRAQALWPALPVIFVSGYADTLAMDTIARATVLRKPFGMEHLRAAVDQALEADTS